MSTKFLLRIIILFMMVGEMLKNNLLERLMVMKRFMMLLE